MAGVEHVRKEYLVLLLGRRPLERFAVPFGVVRGGFVRALAEIEQRSPRVSRRANFVVGQQKFAEF